MKEVTLEDYVLTNIDLRNHCFTIRLKDNEEYIVYHRRPRRTKNDLLYNKRQWRNFTLWRSKKVLFIRSKNI